MSELTEALRYRPVATTAAQMREAADRIEALEAALRTIPPNYSEHLKHCICAWCEGRAKLLGVSTKPEA